MAVEAKYPSNPFSPKFRSRAQAGSVLERLQMRQNGENQSGHFFSSIRSQGPINDSEQRPAAIANVLPHIKSTFDVSSSGRWRRDIPMSSSVAVSAATIPLQPRFHNPPLVAVPAATAVQLPQLSLDQRLRLFQSAGTSTCSRPENVSAQPGGLFSQEFLMQIRDHNVELDAILNNYRNTLREGIEESHKRHWKSLLAMLEQMTLQRLREKDAELENANRRNTELEEKIVQLCSENQMWLNLATQNEALASNLKITLEQVLQNAAAVAAPPPPTTEGYGDTDGTPLPAVNASSCFKLEEGNQMPLVAGEATALNCEQARSRMVCRVCHAMEISILVLYCRHLCLCQECDSKVDTCPVCNSPKSGSVQIIMP